MVIGSFLLMSIVLPYHVLSLGYRAGLALAAE
jgi:hypothetical protein